MNYCASYYLVRYIINPCEARDPRIAGQHKLILIFFIEKRKTEHQVKCIGKGVDLGRVGVKVINRIKKFLKELIKIYNKSTIFLSLIRGAISCSGWQLTQKINNGQYSENKRMEC